MDRALKIKMNKRNCRIYPFYRMLSYDYLFYFSINFLFLTQVKQFSASDAVLLTSLYSLFCVIVQLPVTLIIDKFGKKHTLVLANVINVISTVLIIIGDSYSTQVLAQFLSAIACSTKTVVEPSLLNKFLPVSPKKGKLFSRIEGKGLSLYYYLDAITAFVSGFLFKVNPYLPLILCASMQAIAFFLSFSFVDIRTKKTNDNRTSKAYVRDLKSGIKFILKSNRLKSLLLFAGFLTGTLAIVTVSQTNILNSIDIPIEWIGIIAAGYRILSGIASNNQLSFHEKFRNKSLSIIGTTISIALISVGLTMILKIHFIFTIIVVIVLLGIISVCRGLFHILISRYLGNFMSVKMGEKIFSLSSLINHLFNMSMCFIAAQLLNVVDVGISVFVLGCAILMITLAIIRYMKDKVGLQPNEYEKEELVHAPEYDKLVNR
ncbi:MAG: MFS transporter [Clostridia bacterium]|nr:MFS transporter [Clostridia bacterium]